MADPLSDFLAREQDAFAELEDAAPAPVPVVENDLVDDLPPTQNGHSGSLSNGGDSAADLSSLDAAPVNATPVLNGRGASPQSIGSSYQMRMEEEPEKIKKWRENQQRLVTEKDAAEEKKKEELREQAKKELEQWHAQRQKQLELRKKENREREKEISKEVSPAKDDASSWEKIAKMIDSGSKASKNAPKDNSRMKSLILECQDGGLKTDA